MFIFPPAFTAITTSPLTALMENPGAKARMQMSTVGNLNNAKACDPGLSPNKRGYTFIELTVVIVLIGVTLALTVPRFRYSLLTDDLRSTVRQMVGTIRSLKNEAVRKHKIHMLHFDLESNRLWIESEAATVEERTEAQAKAVQLPEGIRVLDVWRRGTGKEVAGETAIRFTEKGYIEPSAIHIGAEDGRQFTLILSPFLGSVEVLEKYVDFADL
jgi:prepilin-type N-terminal cleavage/methylation domain-containing protein